MNNIKLSNSRIQKFNTCPKSYELFYKKKIVSEFKNSSLYFGTAFDAALNHMLLHKDNNNILEESMEVFKTYWNKQLNNLDESVELNYSPFVIYSKYDYDEDLLTDDNKKKLFDFHPFYFEERKKIQQLLTYRIFEELSNEQRTLYNAANWFCLLNKAKYMLKAYHHDLLPKIKQVLHLQENIQLVDEHENVLSGIIDLVAVLNTGEKILIDNKTSSIEYTNDSVKTSSQLGLYLKMYNEIFPQQKIEQAAFFIVLKKLTKGIIKKCSQCDTINEGMHKTCNNIVENKRCNGEFIRIISFQAKTQIVMDQISENVQEMILENANQIKQAIITNTFHRNFNSCLNKYGNLCEYYNLCWNNDITFLKKKPEK